MRKLYQRQKELGKDVRHFITINKQIKFSYASIDNIIDSNIDYYEWDYFEDFKKPSFNWTDVYEEFMYQHPGLQEINEKEYIKEVDAFNKRMLEIYNESVKREKAYKRS